MTLVKHVRSSIMQDACSSSRYGSAAAVCNCLVLHSQTTVILQGCITFWRMIYGLWVDWNDWNRLSGKWRDTLPVPNPSRKRVCNFFQNALCQKTVRLIWKVDWWKRERKKWRLGKQVGDLQKKIHVLTQQLSAKELELDVLTQEIETLTREHTEAA